MTFPALFLVLSTSMATNAATVAARSPINDPQSQARELLTTHNEFQSPIHPVRAGKGVGGRDSGLLDAQEQAADVIRGSQTSIRSGRQQRVVLRANREKHPSSLDAQEMAARLLSGRGGSL